MTTRERMITGTAPSLTVIRATYGETKCAIWIEFWLVDYVQWLGIAGKVSEEQLHNLAQTIMTKYPHYKATEVMLCFYMLKTGEITDDKGKSVGRQYGTLDASTIMMAFHEFNRYRCETIEKVESEERRRKQQVGECITYERFLELQRTRGQQQMK